MTTTTHRGRHQADEPLPTPQGVWVEFRDAVSPRTVGLIVGVLLLQIGFILSYVGAFHAPTPHRIALGVVSPAGAAQTADQLNGINGEPLAATVVADRGTAEAQIRRGDLSAALVVDPQSTTDTLLVASGGGPSLVTAVTTVIDQVEAARQRTATVTDLVPLQAGDARGLTGFYLVIGWIVGGYLVAALLGVASGARPANPRRAWFRLVAMVPYAVLSGLTGAFVVDQGLGALTGHFAALWGVGTLLVLSAATVTMAFQVLLGVIGIGVTVLVFVILGNPSAGGAYQSELLPPFWRTLTDALPNGAGTDAVRHLVYLQGSGITGHLLVISAYAVGGAVVAVAASHLHRRRSAAVAVD
ncbi:MAG: DUF3533 domain-containing protein [Nakamurella sp.]